MLNDKKVKKLPLGSLILAIAALFMGVGLFLNRGRLGWLGGAGAETPITCPVDETLHIPPLAATFLNENRPISQLLPSNVERTKTSILIEKSKHRLTLYYDQNPIKSYPVVFGDPEGDKQREGDRKTPEGLFRIQDQYPHPQWAKFLWLDYPTAQSWCKHERSKQQGIIPNLSGIGGEIGIHGVPTGKDALVDNRTNWTLGCPSLKTKDIEEVYKVVQIGTLVEILP
jgi:murein L,D-transpeptidase YafK